MSLGLMLNSQILKINRLITSLICQMQISLRITIFPILIISQSSSRVVHSMAVSAVSMAAVSLPSKAVKAAVVALADHSKVVSDLSNRAVSLKDRTAETHSLKAESRHDFFVLTIIQQIAPWYTRYHGAICFVV